MEEELDLAELCALPLGSRGHDSSPIGLQLVDLVDTTTGAVSYVLALHGYGHGAVFRAGTSTLVSWISQHGIDPCKDTGKAWIADFARAWIEGAKRLGLWAGHITVTDEELGEPDDENDENDALRRPPGALR